VAQLLRRSRRSGTARLTVAWQGRVLDDCLHEEESGEEKKEDCASVWQLPGIRTGRCGTWAARGGREPTAWR
jgi:hypothetical protein